MSHGPLSWGAQVEDHAAFVAARRIILASPTQPRAPSERTGKRRSPDGAERNREALLHALRDGRPHRFADLRAALPGLSAQGTYYLCDALKAEGRIDWVAAGSSPRLYQLT